MLLKTLMNKTRCYAAQNFKHVRNTLTYIVNSGHQEEDDGCNVKDKDPTEDDQHDDDAGGRIRGKVNTNDG